MSPIGDKPASACPAPPFKWTAQRESAAVLVAQDEVTDEEIAALIGLSKRTLERLKGEAEFRERVEEHMTHWRQAVRQKGLAIVENRVTALMRRAALLETIRRERGKSEEMAGVPGGKTGLIVHQVKGIGKGEDFQLVDLYMVDCGLLSEMRAHEQQIAKELGQWTDKQTVAFTPKALVGVDLDQI
jgi:hypothetical protein